MSTSTRPLPPNAVHIAARGESTRMRDFIDANFGGPHYPKHLLPTGGAHGETLLGRMVRIARAAGVAGHVVVHANRFTAGAMMSHPDLGLDHHDDVEVRVAKMSDDAMDVYTKRARISRRRIMGSAGDAYTTDFTWERMVAAHESNKFPVTFLVGHTAARQSGAVYNVADNGQIIGMERKDSTNPEDMLNVGAYIFDPTLKVVSLLDELAARNAQEADDPLGHALIDAGLIGAHVLEGPMFNINTPYDYMLLRQHTDEIARRISAPPFSTA